MKTITYSIIIFFFIGLTMCCEKEQDENKPASFYGELVNHSGCKTYLKSTTENTNISDSLSCINYSYDETNNRLIIKHINAAFNCCPDSLYCNISLQNDSIIIQEYEQSALCYCNCLYDLDIEINGIETKTYQIRFIEPYSGEQAEINFEIDLINEKEGSFCVPRHEYPWGLNNL